MLRIQDSHSFRGSFGQMMRGVGWCIVAGLIVATLLSFSIGKLGWIVWFLIFEGLVAVGLLVFARKKKPASYVVKPLTDDDDEVPAALARDPIYKLLLAWGPQAILDGVTALRGHPTKRQTAIYKRSARAIVDLGRYSGGVPIAEVMRPPEDMPVFTAAMDWLERHDYTGKSSDGERVWLSTDGRKRLAEHNIEVKITDFAG